jgi:cyclopropane fatty-acyl-phospholipid synthase-like methyltransferase
MTTGSPKKLSLASEVLSRILLPVIAKRKTYQPVYLNGHVVAQGGRESFQRWEQIEKVIEKENIKSVVDLGCAEGFFVRKSVEKGCFATGVDADKTKLLWAHTTLALDDLENFGFIKMNLTVDNLHLVPAAEMVIFLSVHHHIMYGNGEAYALEFLKKIIEKKPKVVIFEMGQSNEHHYHWAKLLPDMGANPHDWIVNYLKQAGFARVERLCEVKAHKDKIARVTLAAYT